MRYTEDRLLARWVFRQECDPQQSIGAYTLTRTFASVSGYTIPFHTIPYHTIPGSRMVRMSGSFYQTLALQ